MALYRPSNCGYLGHDDGHDDALLVPAAELFDVMRMVLSGLALLGGNLVFRAVYDIIPFVTFPYLEREFRQAVLRNAGLTAHDSSGYGHGSPAYAPMPLPPPLPSRPYASYY